MKWKELVLTICKLTFAFLLLAWLQKSGQLDISQLRRFFSDPTLSLSVLCYFLIGPVFLGTLRWKTLLEGAGYILGWKRAVQLQLTGFFFNTVMPGAVGGDIIKIAYVIRDNQSRSKSQAMVTVLLDRIVGLSGLFLVGWLMMILNFSEIIAQKQLWPIITMMGAISLGFCFFYTAALYHYKGVDPFSRLLSFPVPGFSLIDKLYTAVRIYRYSRSKIILSILYSMIIQFSSLLLFYFMTLKVLNTDVPLGSVAAIFPVGILTTALPITPGGLGVGHVAFDRLFQMVSLDQGATIFNLFVLSQLFLNLTGIIPYLGLKRLPQSSKSESGIHNNTVISII